jgi:acetyl-CoA carboxylase carboxyltransferase component
MGAEERGGIVMRRQVQEATTPPPKAELIDVYRQLIDVYVAAKNGMIDDVIDRARRGP